MLSAGSRMFRMFNQNILLYLFHRHLSAHNQCWPPSMLISLQQFSTNFFFLTKKNKYLSILTHFVEKKYPFLTDKYPCPPPRKQSSSSFSSCSTTPETPQVIFLPPEVQNFNFSPQIWETWSLFPPASYLSISIHFNHQKNNFAMSLSKWASKLFKTFAQHQLLR